MKSPYSWIIFSTYIWTFLVSTQAVQPTVDLNVNYDTTNRNIECSVTNPIDDLSVHVHCPLSETNCYQNCKPVCDENTDSCRIFTENIKCERIKSKPLAFRFTLLTKVPEIYGAWKCMHGPSQSSIGTLIADPKAPTTIAPSLPPVVVPPIIKPPIKKKNKTVVPPIVDKKYDVMTPSSEHRDNNQGDQPKIPPYETEETNRGGIEDPNRGKDYVWPKRGSNNVGLFMMNMTRIDLVITILSLLAISLLVNVAFCIRCILVRRYMDARKIGDPNLGCLERCLCVTRTTRTVTAGGTLYKTDAFGRPDCIYEDPNTILGRRSSSSVRTSHLDLMDTPLGGPVPLPGAAGTTPSTNGGGLPRSRTFPIHHQLVSVQETTADGQHGGTIFLPATLMNHRGIPGHHHPHGGVIYAVPAPRRTGSASVLRGAGGSQLLYDEVPLPDHQQFHMMSHQPDGPPTLMRQASSTGSLYRSRRLMSPTTIEAPLQEEATTQFIPSSAGSATGENDLDKDDSTSMSSELMEECSKNTKRLELSKQMLQKADTLLREAGNLLQE